MASDSSSAQRKRKFDEYSQVVDKAETGAFNLREAHADERDKHAKLEYMMSRYLVSPDSGLDKAILDYMKAGEELSNHLAKVYTMFQEQRAAYENKELECRVKDNDINYLKALNWGKDGEIRILWQEIRRLSGQ